MLARLVRIPTRRLLLVIVALACALNVAYALTRGPERFLADGYTLHLGIAQSVLDGRGICLDSGDGCALRTPVYSVVVAFFLALGWLYPGLSLFQAVVGALVPVVVYSIAVRLVDRRAALLAAFMAAVNPYTVVHSTALQDTAIFNLLTATGIWALIMSRETGRRSWAVAAGVALAAATLTSPRFALFLPCAIAWLAWPSVITGKRRRLALFVALPIVILVGGWTLRNWRVVGAPVLSTEAGMSFWVGNNASTLMFFPDQSMDMNMGYSRDQLLPARQRQLETADEVTVDRLMAGWAFEYVSQHPVQTSVNMVRKVLWAYSGQLSPARSDLTQAASLLLYLPLHLMAAIGLWQLRSVAAPQVLVYLLLGSFTLTTALTWAHTSHASYVEPFLFVYAAALISRRLPAWAG